MLKDDFRLNYQPKKSGPYQKSCDSSLRLLWPKFCWIEIQWCIISNFTWSGQSHLDSHSDFTSTWLYPKTFHNWIRNLDNPALKHGELLASHRDSLRFKGHIYPYSIKATPDSRVLRKWSRSMKCTPTYHPYAMPMLLHILVKRTTN